MKQRVLRIIICILTIVAVWASVVAVTHRFYDKSIGQAYEFGGFYAQPENTVDVLFVGSSRVNCNINPAALWENYGISSYALGLNSQKIDTAYYVIKEALKVQRPKVIVVEVSQAFEIDGRMEGMPSVYGMKYGLNYVESIIEKRDFEDSMDSLLVFPLYHTRYDMITREDYIEEDFKSYPVSGEAGYKGAVEHLYNVAFDGFNHTEEHPGYVFSKETDGYFDRIVELCKREGVNLVFTITPSINTSDGPGVKDYIDRHPEIDFVSCVEHMDEIGINPAEDFIDEGHLNLYGSMKTGKFLGEYLKNNYDLPDHRGDEKYISWDENYEYQQQKILNSKLSSVTGFGTYFDNLPNKNYVCVVALLDGYDSEFIGQLDSLKKVNCNEAVYNLGGIWVVDGINTVYAALGYESDENKACESENILLGVSREEASINGHPVDVNWHSDIGNRTFEVIRSEDGFRIMIDSKDYTVYRNNGKDPVNHGIEILVYDKLSEKVVDCVCFDADNSFSATRNPE